MPETHRQWYALYVHAKSESRVAAALRAKGYEDFPALYCGERKWADRVKAADFPLFPGYVFCRFDPNERLLPILTIPSVMRVLSAGSVPIAIPDEEIAAIQAIVRSGLPSRSVPLVDVGDRVLIEDGPLKGIEGIVVRADKQYRLAVSVELLRRSVVVDMERQWAKPILNGIGAQSASVRWGSQSFQRMA